MKTYHELLKELKQPIPEKFISSKKQGGASIKFVNITDVKDLLDTRLGSSAWESSVKSIQQIGEQLVIVVTVVIHASDGVYAQDGTGVESINLRGYGDIASNAYAQAFRRACESHGLARELWRMELSEEQKDLTRIGEIRMRILGLKGKIKSLGGKVENEDLEALDESELMELGKAYKEQLSRLQEARA